MNQEDKNTKTNNPPKIELKKGFNMYAAAKGIVQPAKEKDIFHALLTKPSHMYF